ncbi:MAG TPA: polyphosphate kinase 2 family protein [Gemmatimonadales bacterium]|nr:polyphosphate kinase 2 family protein [Gemmatimonadales bacterium]
MTLRDKLIVRPGKRVGLADWDPADTLGYEKEPAAEETEKGIARLDALQYLLYAEHRRSLLVVLQGMDGAGKDGTIRHVMRGFNPQGARVTAFREPTPAEGDHDFLWRVHQAVPPRGDVAIFNRSHYEEVLAVRVRKLVPKEVWSRRYEQINRFEHLLVDSGVVVVKFFLHISKGEQRKRLEERLHNPTKQWKLSPSDFADRDRWDEYTVAYEEVLSRCSTAEAPWYVVPADRKWVRNVAVATVLVETLDALDMRFPKPTLDVSRIKLV